jgi:putative transposase
LEDVYPVVFLDALVLKIREGGTVGRRACYLALGVTVEGDRDVLGMWFQETEGAKFWMQVLTDLKQRGVQDILICCVDGLKGFPEAIEAIFPRTTVQTCVVHLIRHSLKYVPRREREQVARDLKPIYTAVDANAAQAALEAFDEKWGKHFPVITQAWLNAWEYVIPFLEFPPEVRRVIYTTNAIEALNRQLRKAPLLTFPWVVSPGEWRAEVGEFEHRERDQRFGRVEPERPSGDQPDLGVDLLDPSVGQPVLDRGEDPVALLGDGARELHERR